MAPFHTEDFTNSLFRHARSGHDVARHFGASGVEAYLCGIVQRNPFHGLLVQLTNHIFVRPGIVGVKRIVINSADDIAVVFIAIQFISTINLLRHKTIQVGMNFKVPLALFLTPVESNKKK